MSNVEDILRSTIDGTEYSGIPQSRVEALLLELKEAIESGGGGGTPIFISSEYTTLSGSSGTASEDGYINVTYTNRASYEENATLMINGVLVYSTKIREGSYGDSPVVTFPIKKGQSWNAGSGGPVLASVRLYKMV